MSDLPSSSRPSSPPPIHSTNTLILTGLPRELFQPEYLQLFRNRFASYGEINQWVPLRSMVRIVIVYTQDEDAMRAKDDCEKLFNGDLISGLRIYTAERNPLLCDSSMPDISYLKVPEIEKNFLISPPGSPPIGWEPVKEDPPNATPLAKDLMAALTQLELMQKSPGVEMLLHPDEGSGISICVEDCGAEGDGADQVDWDYGETRPSMNKWKPVPTSFPSLHACVC